MYPNAYVRLKLDIAPPPWLQVEQVEVPDRRPCLLTHNLHVLISSMYVCSAAELSTGMRSDRERERDELFASFAPKGLCIPRLFSS